MDLKILCLINLDVMLSVSSVLLNRITWFSYISVQAMVNIFLKNKEIHRFFKSEYGRVNQNEVEDLRSYLHWYISVGFSAVNK